MNDKPFSHACDSNKDPILNIIRDVYTQPVTVWEIGSGTGQHACHFARHLPHIKWQPTDVEDKLDGIRLWRDEAQLPNLNEPLLLDVNAEQWPCTSIEALFTANTLHILSWKQIELFFERLPAYLQPHAVLCIYGPFNYRGNFTSYTNARFDQWLKNHDPLRGIRDIEAVGGLASDFGITLLDDIDMPSNNRLLILQYDG